MYIYIKAAWTCKIEWRVLLLGTICPGSPNLYGNFLYEMGHDFLDIQ